MCAFFFLAEHDFEVCGVEIVSHLLIVFLYLKLIRVVGG
jgi:hypothetical protein